MQTPFCDAAVAKSFCSSTILTRGEYTLGTVPAETTVRNTQTSRGRISSRDFIVFSFNSRRNICTYLELCFWPFIKSNWDFLYFFIRYSTLLHLPPIADSTGSEDAGIEPWTVATLALKASFSNHSALIHSHWN